MSTYEGFVIVPNVKGHASGFGRVSFREGSVTIPRRTPTLLNGHGGPALGKITAIRHEDGGVWVEVDVPDVDEDKLGVSPELSNVTVCGREIIAGHLDRVALVESPRFDTFLSRQENLFEGES